jgi:hypothetical protein
MVPFDELGATVNDRWRLANYSRESFPEIAATAVDERTDIFSVKLEDVFADVLLTDSVCSQLDSNFGEPPIIVFRTERFYIEVLPWLNVVLDIHQHAFDGAFAVLAGTSLHTTFNFRTTEKYSDHLVVGELASDRVELLRKGDVRLIRAGAALIHSTFHLDYPSVSLVIRTWRSDLCGPQLSYSRATGIGWDAAFDSNLLEKRIRILRTLSKLRHPDFEKLLARTLDRADAYTAFRLGVAFDDALGRTEGHLYNCRHAKLIELARQDAEERRRIDCLTSFRQRLGSRDHRFFLALLLNVWGRTHILALVRAQYPDCDPAALVSQWIRELAGERECEIEVDGSPYSVRFNDEGLAVFRWMLDGNSGEEPSELLAAGSYGIRADRMAIRALELAVRNSRMFRSLFFESRRLRSAAH